MRILKAKNNYTAYDNSLLKQLASEDSSITLKATVSSSYHTSTTMAQDQYKAYIVEAKSDARSEKASVTQLARVVSTLSVCTTRLLQIIGNTRAYS